MNNETILIVDDNQVLREGLSDILMVEGFTVVTAPNGRKALEQMSVVVPDLILSDISMPEMDGYSFFNAVRARMDWMTIPFIFLTARAEREDVLAGKNLGVEDYLIKPLSRDELVTAVKSRMARASQLRTAQLQQAYKDSLTVLANAIDLRDHYTRFHVQRVNAYTLALAAQLGWQEWRREQLSFGAILHDIGKIHIRESTLKKAGPLSAEEWGEIKQHPIIGAEMIANITYLAPAIPIIRHHHERWDGKGYPDGLVGETIPLGARLVAISDAFDAITSERTYSPARTLEEARDEIIACSGTRYDPAGVEALQSAWEAGEIQGIFIEWQVQNAIKAF